MIAHNKKIIFIHIPKTAGTSIIRVFWDDNTKIKYRKKNVYQPHETIKNVLNEEKFNEYFKFCVIRNPWDRLTSLYRYRMQYPHNALEYNIAENLSFDDYLMNIDEIEIERYCNGDEQICPHDQQIKWIVDDNMNIRVDMILRFENLESDWNLLCNKIEIEADLPHKTVTEGEKDYRKYYTEYTKNLVAERYKDDIEWFNYKF